MLKIDEILKKNSLVANRYTKNNKVYLIDTKDRKVVVKENKYETDIYNYLKTRNFNYYPKILNNENEEYLITEYIEDIDLPKEQKILDLVELVSLLHYKTTHYKEVTEDDYKEIYEDINNNINYLYSYYTDLITFIETKVYMSPSEYLLASNISKLIASLTYSKEELNSWYDDVKKLKKQRLVVLHNNLRLEHFIENETPYLISWNKSKVGLPIFDLYKLYKRHCLEFNFTDLLNKYESKYPLSKDEKKLLFILIVLPDKVELDDTEYNNTLKVSKLINTLYKTENLISPEYSEERKE
ncbi:MAG: hypothetical protein NC181_04465 [Clostridium sp.]|nr:hypothetical protein [Clostridium sp.]MCM1444508.1 hypothetical protein [Candidatus Amulumruptor caecigallinarius]